jgi:hypothetical protein
MGGIHALFAMPAKVVTWLVTVHRVASSPTHKSENEMNQSLEWYCCARISGCCCSSFLVAISWMKNDSFFSLVVVSLLLDLPN